jgi:hypothetical protein
MSRRRSLIAFWAWMCEVYLRERCLSVSTKSCRVTLEITLASCGDPSTMPIRLVGIHGPEPWAITVSQGFRVQNSVASSVFQSIRAVHSTFSPVTPHTIQHAHAKSEGFPPPILKPVSARPAPSAISQSLSRGSTSCSTDSWVDARSQTRWSTCSTPRTSALSSPSARATRCRLCHS